MWVVSYWMSCHGPFPFVGINQLVKEKSECMQAKRPIRPELIPVSVVWSNYMWESFYSPLDGMLVHCRVTPSIKFAGTHLYTWVERGTLRVKCLTQEHNTMLSFKAWTWTARSRVEHTNHEATAPPNKLVGITVNSLCTISGIPLIWSWMGHENMMVLTGWPWYFIGVVSNFMTDQF